MASKSRVSPLLLLGAAMLVRGGNEISREVVEVIDPEEKDEGGKETARGERAPTREDVTSASAGTLNPTRLAGRAGRGGLIVCFLLRPVRVLRAETIGAVIWRGKPEDLGERLAPPPLKGKTDVVAKKESLFVVVVAPVNVSEQAEFTDKAEPLLECACDEWVLEEELSLLEEEAPESPESRLESREPVLEFSLPVSKGITLWSLDLSRSDLMCQRRISIGPEARAGI